LTVALDVEHAPETRGYSTAFWGMAVLITTESMIFIALLAAYFFVRASSSQWPQGGIEAPKLLRPSIFTVVLLGSSLPLFWMEVALRRGRMQQVRMALLLSFLMGLAFIVNTAYDFVHPEFPWTENAYTSLHTTIVGLHAIHVCIGLGMSLAVQVKAWTGRISREHHVTPEVFALYWHFVDVVWIFVFSSLFLSVTLAK
jgi:heme/copper-type cytochrome/quinol oxidase subunit 3